MPKPRKEPPASGELALIERIRLRSQMASPQVRLGIGDDCAILRPPPGHELLVTTDFSLEGRHFRRDTHPPASIGHRALARGLSDIAAMGGKPLAAFLSLALPKSLTANTAFIDSLLDGLLTLAQTHNVPLAGGDTSESPRGANPEDQDALLIDIILLGSAPAGQALRRSGAFSGDKARPGDILYVTGTLGGASAELQSLLSSPGITLGAPHRGPQRAHLLDGVAHLASEMWAAEGLSAHPHLFPQPRLAVGQTLLRRHLATACIDLSDGLSTDLNHLCQASNVAAELDIAQLPAHPLTLPLGEAAQIAAILHGGEDYELLFTASATTRVPRSIAGVPITQIGRILKPQKDRPRMSILSGKDRFELQPQGWEHLK